MTQSRLQTWGPYDLKLGLHPNHIGPFVGLLVLVMILTGCSDGPKIIFEDPSELEPPYSIKLHEAKIVTETPNSLTVDFVYTYKHSIPPSEVRLMVTPNHNYWSTFHSKVFEGTHGSRVNIGLSKGNMKKDNVTQSETTALYFRFEHYRKVEGKTKYLGKIWRQDVAFKKRWKL